MNTAKLNSNHEVIKLILIPGLVWLYYSWYVSHSRGVSTSDSRSDILEEHSFHASSPTCAHMMQQFVIRHQLPDIITYNMHHVQHIIIFLRFGLIYDESRVYS